MERETKKTIPVVFDQSAIARESTVKHREPTLGGHETAALAGRFVKDVPVDRLQQSLNELTGTLATLLEDVKAVGGFELSEVKVGVELSAEGGVNLIGSITAGAKGAMQLTFRPPTEAAEKAD